MSDTPDALTAAEFAQLWRLLPQDAVAYMQARSKLLTSYNWLDVYADEHLRNFTVSRLACLDTLQAVYEAVQRATAGDLSRRDFIREVEQTLRNKGWWGLNAVVDPATGETVQTHFNPSRLQLIYDTNTRAAHAAGQWQRIQRNKHLYPYLRYVTVGDEHVRPEHARWHNLTLPVDHPLWQQIYPPNGWRCRCRVVAMRQEEVDADASPTGAPLRTEPPQELPKEWINRRTGEVRQIVPGVSPGFDYNVGEASAQWQSMARQLAQKTASAPAELGAALGQTINQSPEGAELVDKAWAAWITDLMADPIARKRMALLGFVRPQDVAALKNKGIDVPNAAIRVEDSRVIGKKAKRHEGKGDALSEGDWRALSANLRRPKAVLLDKHNQTLLYVLAPQGVQAQRVVVAPAYTVKGEESASLRTAYWASLADIRGNVAGGQLELLDGSLD